MSSMDFSGLLYDLHSIKASFLSCKADGGFRWIKDFVINFLSFGSAWFIVQIGRLNVSFRGSEFDLLFV